MTDTELVKEIEKIIHRYYASGIAGINERDCIHEIKELIRQNKNYD